MTYRCQFNHQITLKFKPEEFLYGTHMWKNHHSFLPFLSQWAVTVDSSIWTGNKLKLPYKHTRVPHTNGNLGSENSRFEWWGTNSYSCWQKATQRGIKQKNLWNMYRLESDMADLVPGLFMFLMATPTMQHDGKYFFISVFFLQSTFLLNALFLVLKGRFNYSKYKSPI